MTTLSVVGRWHLRLLWLAASNGRQTIKRVIARLNEAERLVDQRIVVEVTARGWKSQVEDRTGA